MVRVGDCQQKILVGILSDKDKVALFNVPYNVTDNISSQAILRHNNIFKQILNCLTLSS